MPLKSHFSLEQWNLIKRKSRPNTRNSKGTIQRPHFSRALLLKPNFLTFLQPPVTRTVSFPRRAGTKFENVLFCIMGKRNKTLCFLCGYLLFEWGHMTQLKALFICSFLASLAKWKSRATGQCVPLKTRFHRKLVQDQANQKSPLPFSREITLSVN